MKNFIYKFLIAALIGLQSTFGMAETAALLPNGMQTFLDVNGHPLTSGTVDFFIPATSTRKNTWKESTETNLNLNPVVLDAGGRAVIYGFGDYRQVVKDRLGNIIWDRLTSSTGTGSGGSGLIGDGNLVGTILPWSGFVAPPNYVFAFGQEITRSGFPEFLAAITSIQAVFCTSGSPILTGVGDTTQIPLGTGSKVEASCLPTSTTLVSKTSNSVTVGVNANASSNVNATFYPYGNGNGTTTFNVPDFRGTVIAGRDNMGGTAKGTLTTTFFGANNPDSIGALGGLQSHTMTIGELVAHTHVATVTDPGHTHTTAFNISNPNFTAGANTNIVNNIGGATNATTASSVTGVTVSNASTGSTTPFPLVQPTITTNYIVKVTPDTSSSIATGVASLGGMTGVLACGSGLTCTANTVSLINSNTLSTTLTSAHFLVGNSSNIASDVAMSGDCGLANTGAVTCTKINGVTFPSSGTSGGIPAFTASTTITSSGVLASGQVVAGGGAGVAPSTIANGQLPATATNDNAAAGKLGEYISSSVASPGTALTTNTPADITSVSLTAGDWDVMGVVFYVPNGATSTTQTIGWTSSTSATLPTQPNAGGFGVNNYNTATVGAQISGNNFGPMRFSLSGTTTVFLSVRSIFTVNTMSAFGFIGARRAR